MTTRFVTLSQILWLLFALFSLPAWSASPQDTAALFTAADQGDMHRLKQELGKGLDVNAADGDGWTALMFAASSGRVDAAKFLIQKGANINARSGKGETPLMAAALAGSEELVKLLLAKGAERNTTTALGLTAAEIARRAGHGELASLLQPAGAVGTTTAAKPPTKQIEAKTNAAAAAFQAGDYNRAASLFRDVVGADPKNALAWHFLGQSLAKTGDLMGARKAYQQALEAAPAGSEVASRTEAMLANLPLPDPATISLPSGLTLYDEMNGLDRRMEQEGKPTLFEDVSRMIAEYGPYTKLTQVQHKLLHGLLPELKVGTTEEARNALPNIQRLRAVDKDNLDLLKQEALALHQLGRYAEAKAGYAEWLRRAGAKTSGRQVVVDNLELANQAEMPKAMDNVGGGRDCPDCPEMVDIPGGRFLMGSPLEEAGHQDDESPQHQVTVAGFSLSKTEITRGQFTAFVNESGYDAGDQCWTFEGGQFEKRSGRNWRNPGFHQDDSHPVACVNWQDAQAYTQWLSKKSGRNYRLPTEAEWEYAARAGTATANYWGDNPSQACNYANVRDRTGKTQEPNPIMGKGFDCTDGYAYTAPVASFEPNTFGLYDMSGNITEWVEDCYHDNYTGAPRDGNAWSTVDCKFRGVRGGSFVNSPEGPGVRIARRGYAGPKEARNFGFGFRLARTN